MVKIWVIAVREYLAAVRTKAFLVSLVLMPLLMAGSAGIPVLLDRWSGQKSERFAIVDRTPGQRLYPVIEQAAQRRNAELHITEEDQQRPPAYILAQVAPSAADPEAVGAQRYELSERVRQGSLSGFLDIGPDVAAISRGPLTWGADALEERSIRYLSNSPMQDAFARWAERVVNEAAVAERCRQAGVSRAMVAAVVEHVPLEVRGLVDRNPSTGALEETTKMGRMGPILVPASLATLMFLVIMIGITPLMHCVIEEKMQRIAEVLLGSVQPFQLMAGKLLGMVGVTLTLATLYLAGGYWALSRLGLTLLVPISLLAWFVVFLIFAVLMYGSLFLAIGAACTDTKESQALTVPLVLLITLPLFAVKNILQDPNGLLATGASLFPFSTPMLMVMRLGLPPGVPWWQPVLGMVGVLAATMLCVYAAGRIFRVGILLQGKGASVRDMARWVIRG